MRPTIAHDRQITRIVRNNSIIVITLLLYLMRINGQADYTAIIQNFQLLPL